MKICFLGLGSIGSRHIFNLVRVLGEKNIAYEIHALRSTNSNLNPQVNEFIKKQFFNIEDMDSDYDIIFITNPTSLHYASLCAVINKAKHFFIEKPVFEETNYDVSKFKKEQGIKYVACPLRYTNVISYLKNYLQEQKVFSVRAICSTYLPDWRPNIDYRTTYSAKEELGGGVSIDLIHEWDYLVYLFGLPEKVTLEKGKFSDLEIASDDQALYIAKYADKLISLHLDYFGRFARREIEIYLADDVVVGDIVNSQVRFLNSRKIIDLAENRNDYYLKEIRDFISMIEGLLPNKNDIDLAVNVLKIAKGEI